MTTNSNLTRVSVVIPTHNPRADYLARVLDALRLQTLPREQWEIIVIDNASTEIVGGRLDLSWHANARIVREERLGLTFARLRGFAEAKGDLIVMVDDDNLLAPDYLANAVEIASKHPDIGAFGGKCLPEFETAPEPWMREFLPLLALRDHGEKEIVSGDILSPDGARRAYPDKAAPIGAGMVLRSSAARAYAERLQARGERQEVRIKGMITDRKGDSLASAGDNDLVFTILRDGWKVGYFPQLKVTHLIPSSRLTVDYLARANRGVQRSWVEVLRKHEACPWPVISRTSAPLRKVRAFFKCRGWQKPAGFTRWQACCGQFEGRIRS
jgi:glycosyltransferase involved in cell wall biosynthesis